MIRATTIAALTLVLAALCAPAIAAPPAPAAAAAPHNLAAQREAMAKLSFLHGRWTGEARMTRPDGSVVVSHAADEIEPLMGGLILTIGGKSYAPGAPADAQPVGENFGILSYDDHTGRYDLRSYSGGDVLAGDGDMLPDGAARWRLQAPDRLIRFTARADGPDGWIETIEFSRDGGAAWAPGLEIRFKRAP